MSEPRAKLTLVDAALAEVPHAEKDEPTLRRMLAAFAPSIAKRARQDERAAYAAERSNLIATHQGQLEGAENAYRVAATTAHKAGHAHGFWKGLGVGIACGAIPTLIGAAWYGAQVVNPAFDAAARFQMQQTVVDRLDRAANPPAPNYPSETP